MSSKTFKEALQVAWDALIPLVVLNLVWFLLTLLIITAIPAFGALYYATNRIAHGESADLKTFFEGFKKQFWTSWKWGLATFLVYALLLMNVWFYGQFDGTGYLILQSLFVSLVFIFTCALIYVYPFLLEQDKPLLKIAFRNSFAALIRYMGRSFGMLILFLVLIIASIFLPPLLIMLTVSLMLYLANWQTLTVIQAFKKIASESAMSDKLKS